MIKEGERGHPTLRFFRAPSGHPLLVVRSGEVKEVIAGFQNDKRRRREKETG